MSLGRSGTGGWRYCRAVTALVIVVVVLSGALGLLVQRRLAKHVATVTGSPRLYGIGRGQVSRNLPMSVRGRRTRNQSVDRRRPAMHTPLVPRRESERGVAHGFAPVELTWCWDLERGCPLGQFLV